jgi:recombination associated protein RdgC
LFKNVRFFRLEGPLELDAATLEAQLAARLFRPCGPLETTTLGWCPPIEVDRAALVHGVNRCLLVSARRQERLLPSAVVAEALDERVAEIEGAEVRSVGRAERRRLREHILAEMLPRAFLRSRRVYAYLDTDAGWLVVDAASDKTAEEIVSLLRQTLGSLPAKPPRPSRPIAQLLTAWVQGGDLPRGFALGQDCELRDPDDSQSVVRCRGQDLSGDEIQAHLRAGKQVVKLALERDERLSFLLHDDLSLKRLRLADVLSEQALDADQEDQAARLDAEFALIALELRGLLEQLQGIFELAGDKAPPALPSHHPERA